MELFKRKSKFQIFLIKLKNFEWDNLLLVLVLPYLISLLLTYIIFIINMSIISSIMIFTQGPKAYWEEFCYNLKDEWEHLFDTKFKNN